MKQAQHLILVRGLPGAGKTVFAQLISENSRYPFYSVDDYFTDENGHYHFRFEENHKAYKQCIEDTENAIIAAHAKIIVHNTFTLSWEMEPYFALAKKYQLQLHVLTIEHYHDGINAHEVSNEQLKKMADKYQVKLF